MQKYGYRKNGRSSHRVWMWGFFLAVACAVACGLAVCLLYPFFAGRKKEAAPVFAVVSSVQTQLQYRTVKYRPEQVNKGPLILVNNEHMCEFLENDRLVSVYDEKGEGYLVSDTTVRVQKSIMAPLNEMMRDFQRLTGYQEVMVASGYRSKEHQARIFQNSAMQEGLTRAETWIARPGGSEHHTGYVVDFNLYTNQGLSLDYDGTGECRWINTNCQEYGFVVRYPMDKTSVTGIDYEPWHFRYVGKPHAIFMTEQNLCLEEYIDALRSYPFDGGHLQVQDGDGVTYEIYYVPAAEQGETGVPVPLDRDYEISGNNVDGFVITVTL